MAASLVGTGLLTTADIPAFARYCRTYALWSKLAQDIEQQEKPDRQSILALAKVDESLRRLEAKFGLTPSDRTGIRVAPPKPEGKGRFFETR
jgi:phage terminase small subunit